MCYDQSKPRLHKPKGHIQPLIPHKRMADNRDKENQKHNQQQLTKMRTHTHHDFYPPPTQPDTRSHQHQPSQTTHFLPKDRHPQIIPPQHYGHHQPSRTLTFATVKHGKPSNNISEQSSFISLANEPKRQPTRANPLLEKERLSNMTERNQKIVIERVPEKKQIAPSKPVFAAKVATIVVDDFLCTQELDFRPVEKKSLLPEKKYPADRTTSKFDFGKAKKPQRKDISKEKDLERELRQFQLTQKMINTNTDAESLSFACQLQDEYSVNANYLERNHKGLIWWSRAILVDWMRHICYEFGLQRDTYHIAVVLLDNYLARITNVPKSILQAIGATCLFIASKLEQFQCRQSKQFVKSTNNSCSIHDIHELQIKIVMTLRFKLNPPTLFSLANTLMSQWDTFVQSQAIKHHPFFNSTEKVHFKQLDEGSYRMFRQLMQLIDCSLIDIQTAQYKARMLVCSFLYLLIGRQTGVFDSEQIVTEFPCSSLYLIDEKSQYNNIFNSFVQQVFGFSLFEMLPTVQYCATYFGLGFSYQKPMIGDENELESMSLEEYCSYQTYNSTMLKTVKHRYRGIY